MISVDITKPLSGITINAKFEVEGGCSVLSGPSGAGKTSIINMLSGLMTPASGRIVINSRILYDSGKGINLPPDKRRAGYVFQESRLFPHMTVRKNLLYGRKNTGDKRILLDDVADLLGISKLMDRYPKNLSGGEKQRVALGRALLSSPEFLLMDEPMASLDSSRRDELINYISRTTSTYNIPVVYVTHNVDEIIRLSDQVGIMESGTLTRFGPAIDILNSGDFIDKLPERDFGVVCEGTVVSIDRSTGMAIISFGSNQIEVVHAALKNGDRVRFRIPAMDVVLATEVISTSARNIYPALVTQVKQANHFVDVKTDIGGFDIWARISMQSFKDMNLCENAEVYVVIKSVVASYALYILN